jgi:hypothetical protein
VISGFFHQGLPNYVFLRRGAMASAAPREVQSSPHSSSYIKLSNGAIRLVSQKSLLHIAPDESFYRKTARVEDHDQGLGTSANIFMRFTMIKLMPRSEFSKKIIINFFQEHCCSAGK